VPWVQRVPIFAAAFLLIVPGWETDLMGLVLLSVVAVLQWKKVRGQKAKGALTVGGKTAS